MNENFFDSIAKVCDSAVETPKAAPKRRRVADDGESGRRRSNRIIERPLLIEALDYPGGLRWIYMGDDNFVKQGEGADEYYELRYPKIRGLESLVVKHPSSDSNGWVATLISENGVRLAGTEETSPKAAVKALQRSTEDAVLQEQDELQRAEAELWRNNYTTDAANRYSDAAPKRRRADIEKNIRDAAGDDDFKVGDKVSITGPEAKRRSEGLYGKEGVVKEYTPVNNLIVLDIDGKELALHPSMCEKIHDNVRYKLGDAATLSQEQLEANTPAWVADKEKWTEAVAKATDGGKKDVEGTLVAALYKKLGGSITGKTTDAADDVPKLKKEYQEALNAEEDAREEFEKFNKMSGKELVEKGVVLAYNEAYNNYIVALDKRMQLYNEVIKSREPVSDSAASDFIFPADSDTVNDKEGHFPIPDVAHGRNALAQVAKYDKLPEWYSGDMSLDEFKKYVRDAVAKAFPSIEVSDSAYEAETDGLSASEKSALDRLMDLVMISSSRYNSPSKITIYTTPKGNWALEYDGHSVSTIRPVDGFTRELADKVGVKFIEDGLAGRKVKDSLAEEFGITEDMNRGDAHDKLREYLDANNHSEEAIKKVALVLLERGEESLKVDRKSWKELMAVSTTQNGKPQYSYKQKAWTVIKDEVTDDGNASAEDILQSIREWANKSVGYLSERSDYSRGYKNGILQAQEIVLDLLDGKKQ